MEEIIYEQEEPQVRLPAQPKKFFWKPDGKAILIEGEGKIQEIMARGWRQFTEKEKERFREGNYNPIYDMRGQDQVVNFNPQDYTDGQRKDVTFLDVILC